MHDPDASPFHALPVTVVVLTLAMFAVEVVFMLAQAGMLGSSPGGEDWRILALQRFAFSGEVWGWMAETGRWPADQVARIVTYPFVHFSFSHMALVCVFVLALGKMAGETFSAAAVPVIFFGASIAGALAYAWLLNDPRPLAGGYPGAFGLIGSYTFILWVGYRAVGSNQFRAFTLIGLLLGIQLLFGLFFDTANDWVAEIVGFIVGFLISPLLVPGGFARVVARLRER